MQITKLPKKASSPKKGVDLLGLDTPIAWNTEGAFAHLASQGLAGTKRTAERRIHELGLWPLALDADALRAKADEKVAKDASWATGLRPMLLELRDMKPEDRAAAYAKVVAEVEKP
jgi:hypothetical protein